MRTLFEVQLAVITQKTQLPLLGHHKFQLESKHKTGIDNMCDSFPSQCARFRKIIYMYVNYAILGVDNKRAQE